MLVVHHAPRTRSVRVVWLLEELGLPYTLEKVAFSRPVRTFEQATPLGKIPVLEDDGVVMCESGAILEYVLERYGEGRLAPAVGTLERAAFLQWMHFPEGTAYAPLSTLVWHRLYREDEAASPGAVADATTRAHAALDFVERSLGDRAYLLGEAFTAADIMMTFTLAVAGFLGLLGERHPRLERYLGRMRERPAFARAMAA